MEQIETGKSRKKYIIIIVSVLVFVLLATSVFLIVYNIKINKLTETCKNRVENAQYLPNVDKLAPAEDAVAKKPSAIRRAISDGDADQLDFSSLFISHEGFDFLVEELGTLHGAFDYEYSVHDIKNTATNLFRERRPLNQWIYNGKSSPDYFISYDKKNDHLTVLQKSSFQPVVYDSELGQGVENDYFEDDPLSLEIFTKIDYYYNQDGVEVVECEIVDVLYCYEDVFIAKYQYIKNIKDTSFTRYVITPCVKLNVEGLSSAVYGLTGFGYDIDSDNPTGTFRQFVQLDYVDENDISLLYTTQWFTGAYTDRDASTIYPGSQDRSIVTYYRKLNDQRWVYNSAYCYNDYTTSGGVDRLGYFLNSYAEKTEDTESPLPPGIFVPPNISDTPEGLPITWHGRLASIIASNHAPVENTMYGPDSSMYIPFGTKPDKDYKSKSIDKIVELNREMYYYNPETQWFGFGALPYYEKKETDNDTAYLELQNLPLILNQTLSSLAKNTNMSDENIATNLAQSPEIVDISYQTGKYSYELFIDSFLQSITENIVEKSFLKNNYELLNQGILEQQTQSENADSAR